MKLNNKGKLIWFIVAYSPMFFALTLKFCLTTGKYMLYKIEFSLIICIILLFSIYLIINMLEFTEDTINRPEHCKIIESSNTEYIFFVVSYLIPFYNIDFTIQNIIPTIVILIIIAILYVRTPLFAVNPILNLLGYNLYKSEKVDEHEEVIIISHEKFSCATYNMELFELGENIYITTKIKECEYDD